MTIDIERERREHIEWMTSDEQSLAKRNDMASLAEAISFNAWLAAKRAAVGSAEPVAWLVEWGDDRIRAAGKLVQLDEPEKKYACNRYIPLYTAPPAPVSAEPVWTKSKIQMPDAGRMIVKRWSGGSVWAGLFSGSSKDSSFDEWVYLPSTGSAPPSTNAKDS